MTSFSSIVQNNLCKLVESTILNVELCNILMVKKLSTVSEYEQLKALSEHGLNSQAATYLYTSVLRGISAAEVKTFVQALRDGNNLCAVEVLESTGIDHLIDGDRDKDIQRESFLQAVKFIAEFNNGKYTEKGKFEGINFQDEQVANTVMMECVKEEVSNKTQEMVLCLERNLKEQEEFMDRVKNTVKCLEDGKLWWNPNSSQIPSHYIEMKVQKLNKGKFENTTISMKRVVEFSDSFFLLAGPPGMGKTSAATKLEENFRSSQLLSRIVVNCRLNLLQNILREERKKSQGFTLKYFLKKFVPYIPIDSLPRPKEGKVKVIVILDGVDEVFPKHRETLFRVFHSFLKLLKESADLKKFMKSSNTANFHDFLQLEKVIITTRSHLINLIEQDLGVTAHILLPLEIKQQVNFLSLSTPYHFPEEKAEQHLQSLSPSVRSLIDNPQMLSLMVQLIQKEKAEDRANLIDLLDIYEHFIKEKSLQYLVEKEAAAPRNQQTHRRVKSMFDDNLPHYYTIALAQLRPPEAKDWPVYAELPGIEKTEELIGFGLLTLNFSSNQIEFIHRSFAEFFYAHLITAHTTAALLMDALFRGMYWSSWLQDAEEFVLCTLKKRQNKTPAVVLLDVSTKWLSGTIYKKEVLKGFLLGRLFPLLGVKILSSCSSKEMNLPEVIEVFISVSLDTHNLDLIKWLIEREDGSWAREHLFCHSLSNTYNQRRTELATVFLCTVPEGLKRSLQDTEVLSLITSCDSVVEIVGLRTETFHQRRLNIETRLNESALRKAMKSQGSVESTLKCRETAWWMAELLTKDELYSLLTDEDTRVTDLIGTNPRGVESVWGEYFLGDLLTFRFKFGEAQGKSVFEGQGKEYALGKLWGRLVKGGKGVTVLRQALLRNQDWSMLEWLEERMEQWGWSNVNRGNIIEWIVGDEKKSLWDKVDEIPFDYLPFVIRYGKLHQIKKYLSNYCSVTTTFPVCSTALILSLLVDATNDTYNHVKSAIENVTRLNRNELLTVLLRTDVNDLRNAAIFSFSHLKGPLVRQISWGEVVIRLLPTVPTTSFSLTEDTLKNAVLDLLQKSTYNEVTEVLHLILHNNSSLRQFFLREVASEASKRRNFGDTVSHSRLRGLLLFVLRFDAPNFNWDFGTSYVSVLMNVIMEIRLCCSRISPKGSSEVSSLLQTLEKLLRNILPSEKRNILILLSHFYFYKTEEEWDVIFQTLEDNPQHSESWSVKCAQIETGLKDRKCRVYELPVTPLLLVGLRYYSVEEIGTIVDDESIWDQILSHHETIPPVELVHLAIKLGSLKLLKRFGHPSLLSWRDGKQKSFLEISRDIWGDYHEVTAFLEEKFDFTFCN